MPPEDKVRLQHMIEALEAAQRFVAGRHRQDLDSDEMLRMALTRALEVVGEAASRISRATRVRATNIPWRQLAGMRNRLVHAYFDVDRAIVWTTASRDVPEVLAKVRSLLEES